MSAGARIASAFHPTNLMAKCAKEGAGNQHVVYDVMREHDVIAGRPNQISKYKIIRVIVGCGGDTADFLQSVTFGGDNGAECETHSLQHVSKSDPGRHLNRHAQSFK